MRKVLIADDSMFMRKSLRAILEKAGITNIIEAENGQNAVELFKQNQPDVSILDITMPKMDGISALKVMKKDNKDAKIIMCSAMAQKSFVQEAMNIGAADFITKPFEPLKIVEVIKKLLIEAV